LPGPLLFILADLEQLQESCDPYLRK
jgi:hypothetical protein